jgi:transposase
MAVGTRQTQQRTEDLWIATSELAVPAGHPFYERLNQILDEHDFDSFVEDKCRQFYAAERARPSLVPGIYFRLLLVGYFEGIDSEGGIAWRAEDSLSLRRFLAIGLNEAPPDHSTISRTRRLCSKASKSALTPRLWRRMRLCAPLCAEIVGKVMKGS